MEVEYEIQLADIAEVFVEDLHEALHQFQDDQLILVLVDDGYEVETGVSFVDDLVLLVVQEIAHLGVTRYY
jgi:uncharacterized protein YacL